MKSLTSWWNGKTTHKRQNWMLLCLGFLFIASGFVEALPYIAVLAIIPVAVIIKLEISRP